MKRESILSTALVVCALAVPANAEVRSYTLGIHVNCPAGLGECFPNIREGLERMEGIASVPESPNCANDTVDIKPRTGKLLDPVAVAQRIKDVGIGAHLRVMEATVDGHMEKRGKEFWLRISGKHESIRLTPLTQKAQYNPDKKKQLPLTRAERQAYKELTGKLLGDQTIVRITGPVKKVEGKDSLTLEVKTFEIAPAADVAKTVDDE